MSELKRKRPKQLTVQKIKQDIRERLLFYKGLASPNNHYSERVVILEDLLNWMDEYVNKAKKGSFA